MDAFWEIWDILGVAIGGLRRAWPALDTWFWIALFALSIVLGIRHVALHMRRGRVSLGGIDVWASRRTDESGASLFRSAESVQRRPSLNPLYGKPAWLRGLPYPALVGLAWLWVYARWAVVTLAGLIITWASLRLYRAVREYRHRRQIVRPLAAVLGPALGERPERILQGLVIPPDYAKRDDVELIVPLPDHHTPEQLTQAARLVAIRVGGEWNHKRSPHAPYTLTLWRKPAPPEYLEYRDVAPLLRQGSMETPLMGLGAEMQPLRIEFGGPVAHLGLSAGTGAGKSSLIRLLVMQLSYHGVRDFVAIDTKLVSLRGLEFVPGMRIYNRHIEDMWRAIEEFRLEMDERYEYLYENPDATFPPAFLILEEQNDFAMQTRIAWSKIKEKGDPARAPVWDDVATILLKARQVNMRVIGVYQRMTAEVVGGASDGTLRDMFGDKALARFSPQAWDSLVGTRPRPSSPHVQGRWIHVRGGLHRQVQVPYVTVEDVQDFLDSAPALVSRHYFSQPLGPSESPTAPLSPTPVPRRVGRPPYEPRAVPGGQGDGDTAPPSVPSPAGSEAIQEVSRDVAGEAIPLRLTLEEACRRGIIPLSYEAAKRRRSRAIKAGKPFPEGVKDGRTTYYTVKELKDWWESEQRQAQQQHPEESAR